MSAAKRALIAVLAAALVSAAGAGVAPAQPSPPSPPAPTPIPAATQPRLEGTFQLSGHVTVAHNVRGEHAGEVVRRTWTFTPLCVSGPCAQVRLFRGRANATDTLILNQQSPGHYAGTGRFFAPLKCAGQVYATGEEVPFQIKLHVTATATAPDGTTVASAITASYVNKTRLNLTRCVIVLGHDSARYTGSQVPA